MEEGRVLASCLLLLAGSAIVAPDACATRGRPSTQSSAFGFRPLQSSATDTAVQKNTQSQRSDHHVGVPGEDSQRTELTEAEAAIEKKEYAAAEVLLDKFVLHEPANYVGWFDLGFVENALGKVKPSIAAYRKSVTAKPDVFESNLNLGLQLAKTGQPGAERFLRAATELKPSGHVAEGHYRAWLSLGHTIEPAKPEEALAAYQKAASFQPQEAEPHLSAGHLLEQQDKFSDAEQEYKQGLSLDSSSSDAVIGLANIYMRGRRFPEAEDSLRKLLAAHADSAPLHIQLGRVLAAEGKTDAAISELQAGVELAPDNDAAKRDLAELYASAGKNDLAEHSYRNLLVAHPNDAELHRLIGQALLRQKKFPDAQQAFLAAIKIKPEMGEAYGDLAFAASENKNYALVIRALQARAKLLPESPVTYFLKASAFDHLHDVKNAAANYHLFLNTASGKYPDYEWQAKHRLIAIEPKK